MRKLFTLFLSLIVATMLVCPIAHADSKDMWAQVYKLKNTNVGDPELEEITTNITFKVLQRNSDTAETLTVFGDDTSTSLTNPVTTTNFASASYCKGRVQFRVDPGEATDTYVDLIVVDAASGYTAFVEDFDQYQHKIVIDERPINELTERLALVLQETGNLLKTLGETTARDSKGGARIVEEERMIINEKGYDLLQALTYLLTHMEREKDDKVSDDGR